MRKRIPSGNEPPPSRKRRTLQGRKEGTSAWRGEILLYLECADPRLLDKETAKVFQRLQETSASIQGPVPLPVRRQETIPEAGPKTDVHRRLYKILFPTDKTISLLEKLPLSASVHASIQVEEAGPQGPE